MEPEEQFVPAPTDVVMLNAPCSICMEQFKSVWHAKTQQPVWMDAIKVGDKYYHASCYSEVNRGTAGAAASIQNSWQGGGGAISRNGAGIGGDSSRNTPDPILGKRKFDGIQ
jgi:pre-mRNA cleavage complex 2 protein Pcf11